MTRSICNSCEGVCNGDNPMDVGDCENHCPFSCDQCGKSYLMPKGGYDTIYCSQDCSENKRQFCKCGCSRKDHVHDKDCCTLYCECDEFEHDPSRTTATIP